jgi:hypothetical protein
LDANIYKLTYCNLENITGCGGSADCFDCSVNGTIMVWEAWQKEKTGKNWPTYQFLSALTLIDG